MNIHEKTMFVISKLKYNSRQVAEVLEISTKGAENKMKQVGSNQFLEKDFKKITDFLNELQKEIKDLD
ncbi:hypothetical protein [Epilithonimonas sp. UC225_85]|uniref:hypothetical protein n=1 Tax=Epilithonimonas sp. UC225_85 TaxID=3350167 RepID=UPI0036D2BD99